MSPRPAERSFEADGLTLRAVTWRPAGEPRAAVVLAHGYGEHAGRYGPLARALTRGGYALFALDQRGHGRSGGERARVRDTRVLVRDLDRFAEGVASELPGAPLVLFGHSMGGAVAAELALARPDLFAAMVLSAPYLAPARAAPGWLRAVVGALAAVLPGVPVERLDPNDLSRDPSEAAAYAADPLVHHGPVVAVTAAALLAAGERVLRDAGRLALPLLVLHGAEDRIAAPEGSRRLVAAAASADKTHIEFPGAYHEVMNDLDREAFLSAVTAWLDERVSAFAPPAPTVPARGG